MIRIRKRHFFVTGLLLLLLGTQLRVVEGYVLGDRATRFLAKHFGEPATTAKGAVTRVYLATGAPASYTIRPPRWIGYLFLSLGFVLTICFWPPMRRSRA